MYRCETITNNKFCCNLTKIAINENSLPSCPPVFCPSDLTHPFTSPVLLPRGQRVCNAVACAPPFRPQLVRAPLKGGEKETSHQPSPCKGEGKIYAKSRSQIKKLRSPLIRYFVPPSLTQGRRKKQALHVSPFT